MQSYGGSCTIVSTVKTCCFLAGQFVLYMAGVFETYESASLFIAMTDSAFLRLIFRQHPDPMDNFYIHGFLFVFLEADDEEDIFYYDISHGEFNMTFAIAKIETTGNCNPLLILISCTLSGQFTNDSLSANTV